MFASFWHLSNNVHPATKKMGNVIKNRFMMSLYSGAMKNGPWFMRHEEAHPQFFEKPLQTEVNQIVLEIFQKFFVEKDIFEFYMGHNLLFWSTEKRHQITKPLLNHLLFFQKWLQLSTVWQKIISRAFSSHVTTTAQL